MRRLLKDGDMTRRGVLAGLMMLPAAFVGYRAPGASRPRPEVNLTISTDGDLLAFKPVELTCPTAALVHLTFIHTGKYISQDHDWVLTLPDEANAVDQAALRAGEAAGYVAPRGDKRVLAATRMCGKGEQVRIDFIAPAPGEYPFICTYPGHAAFMHGVLHVTAS
jgi:azurin